jgi:hypothetical protein
LRAHIASLARCKTRVCEFAAEGDVGLSKGGAKRAGA